MVPQAAPCPFCGNAVTATEYTRDGTARVHCGRCGATGPVIRLRDHKDIESVAAAIAQWNARG